MTNLTFTQISDLVRTQFNTLATNEKLFRVAIPKGELYNLYLDSFPEGTNDIYIERREHDCQHCRNFIRDVGNVVAIIDNKMVSIWDIELNDTVYSPVIEAMRTLIHSSSIVNIFLNKEANVSKPHNIQILEDGKTKKWPHFSCEVPNKFVERDIDTKLNKARTNYHVFNRALLEISAGHVDTILELINNDSLYRGNEHKEVLTSFRTLLNEFNVAQDKDLFTWASAFRYGSRIRNSVIGTLLIDIAEGKDLEQAVKAFEAKIAPSNYRRSSAIITQGMRDKALKTIADLGVEDSLHRRVATSRDISINDVIFADRATSMLDRGSLSDLLQSSVKTSKPTTGQSISIEDFVASVVPKATKIEAYLPNRLTGNLATVTAPKHSSAPNILAWDNNFSWSYNGDVTDSMKERVKAAGGKVNGVFRFSIQWNEELDSRHCDLDAHCYAPGGEHIFHGNKLGRLDVDIIQPLSKTAVENITWNNMSQVKDGKYKFTVRNYNDGANTNGFRAEIEMAGELITFDYRKPVKGGSDITVAIVTVKDGKFSINANIPTGSAAKDVWSITTENWYTVSMITLSPNHWENNEHKVGNKHHFFALDKCYNPEQSRGLYNEFLSPKLHESRKVFEVLGSKLMCEPSPDALSVLGFSDTVRNTLDVKVDGKPYTINF